MLRPLLLLVVGCFRSGEVGGHGELVACTSIVVIVRGVAHLAAVSATAVLSDVSLLVSGRGGLRLVHPLHECALSRGGVSLASTGEHATMYVLLCTVSSVEMALLRGSCPL